MAEPVAAANDPRRADLLRRLQAAPVATADPRRASLLSRLKAIEPEPAEPSIFQQRRPTLTPGVAPRTTANLGRASLGAAPQQRTPLPPLGTETVGRTPEGRPIIRNPDGSFSTERTITVTDPRINGGRPTNIPSIFQRREVPQELAIRIISRSGGRDPETGRVLEGYDSIEEAVRAAQERSHSLGPMPQDRPQARLTPGMLNRGMASVLPGARTGPTRPVSERFGETGAADEAWREQFAKIAGRSPESVGVTERWQANGWLFDNNLDTLPAPPPPLAPSLGGALVQGVAGGFAGIPEAAGVQHQAAQRSLAEQYSRIDRGERPYLANIDSPAVLARITDYLNGNAETRQRLRTELDIRPVQEEPAFAAGQALRSAAAEAAPIDPRLAESFPVQLAQGIGSTGAFVATGLAGRLARIPGGIAVAGTGALVNGAEGFRSAVQQGASFEDAVKASRLNAIAGVSEALPIARLFDRLDAASGGQFRRALTNAVKGGGEEAAQEVFQTVFNNLVESKLVGYDPTQGTFTGTPEAGGVGFTVGALFNFAASMLGLRPRRNAREFTEHLIERQPQQPRQPRPATRGPPFERGESVGPTEPPAPPAGVQVVRTEDALGGSRTETVIDAPDAAAKAKEAADRIAAIQAEAARKRAEIAAGGASAPQAPAAAAPLPPDIPRTIYRGSGRGDRGEVYGGAAVPILGEGRYSAFTREDAERFGPNVEQGELTLSNPLVIRSDEEWRALTQEAGWRVPNPFGQSEAETKQQIEALQSILRQRGHDGVIVHWDDSVATDYDAQGRGIKLLRNVFGQPQAFELEAAQDEEAARRAAEKSVNERQAAEQAARQTILVQPDFIPQATITQVPKQGDRFFRGGGMVANGHVMLLEDAAPPRLITAFERHVSQNRGVEELKPDSSERLMKQAKKHDGETFKPLVVRDPSLRDESAPPIVYAKSGGKWIALNGIYYDYLTRNGFEIRWKPSATKDEGFPLLILKDGKPVGGIMRMRVDERDIPDLEAALSRFQAAEASPTPIDPNAPKLGRDVLSPPRSAAQVEARAKALLDRLRRAKTPEAQQQRAKELQAQTIAKLNELEKQAAVREEQWRIAQERADKEAESKSVAEPSHLQFSYKRGFVEGYNGVSLAKNAGTSDDIQEAFERGHAAGATFAKRVPPPVNPEEHIVEFLLPSASGRGAKFRVPGTTANIAALRDRIKGTGATEKFFSVPPGAVRPTRAVQPSRDIEGVEILFPDDAHAALIDLAANPNREAALALFDHFRGYVENLAKPSDVIALARDYMTEVRDMAAGSREGRGGQPDHARFVVDPDRQTRYLQRERLGATEAELPETAYSVQAARGPKGPGVNYVGNVPDRIGGTPRAVPLRREDILRELIGEIGTPVYQGRVKSRIAAGFYRRRIGEVRIRTMSDIETAAHEIAHALDDQFPEIRKQWNPATKANETIRAELRGVSYDQSKLFEGFAEYIRLWMTQGERAIAAAPHFTDWWESYLNRSPHGPALRRARDLMHEWFAQDALTRARSKIGRTKDINAGLATWRDRFRLSVFDDLHGIMRMEKDISGGVMPGGAYETARLVRASRSIIEGALIYGAPMVRPDGSHQFAGKGLHQILDQVGARIDDFLMYAVGRSAQELMSQGRERLFTRAEVKAMVALETPVFRQAFDELQQWQKMILNFAQAKGIIDPAKRATWNRALYMPFHRVGTGSGKFEAVSGDWKGIKALTGGDENLRPVLENIIGNAAMLIDAALKNEVRLGVAALARGIGGAHFMAKIPKEERSVAITSDQIADAIKNALGVPMLEALPVDQQILIDQILDGMGPVVEFLLRGQTPTGRNLVAVLRGGQAEYYEVADPLLFRSLMSLTRPTKNFVIRWLAIPKRLGQASITLTFDFLAANFLRDSLMGAIMSRFGFKFILDGIRGFKSRITTDENYREYIANGGGFSSYLVDEDASRKHLERYYTRRGIDFKTVLHTPAKILLALERFADAVEMSTRLGEYRRARMAGAHARHAAYLAREVSTDFAMRGGGLGLRDPGVDNFDRLSAAVGFLYDTAIFFKAAVNGMDRVYRGLRSDPHRLRVAIKTGILAGLSVGLYILNRELAGALYDDLEDWDKDLHWHFFLPTPETMQAAAEGRELPPLNERFLHFRLPKIWELGAISSIAERSVGRLWDEELSKLPFDAWRILRDTFSVEFIPQAVAPIVEVARNRDSFTGVPIESRGDADLLPWARGVGSRPTTEALGEQMRHLPRDLQLLSPPQIESLLRGYLNTWASYGLMLSDGLFFDETPDLRIDQYPIVRRFYQREPARSTRYVSEFYEVLAEAVEMRRTMKLMEKTYRPRIVAELELTPENRRYTQLTGANKKMGVIRNERRQVRAIRDLPHLQAYANDLAKDDDLAQQIARLRLSPSWGEIGALKRELDDMWLAQRNALAKRVMLEIENQKLIEK